MGVIWNPGSLVRLSFFRGTQIGLVIKYSKARGYLVHKFSKAKREWQTTYRWIEPDTILGPLPFGDRYLLFTHGHNRR